ncbi:MAG: hypothetical protein LIO96_14890 [Lachnospiraceae bacterium]|nr:hypothetical protein [Lachnospiraceae bacterium]
MAGLKKVINIEDNVMKHTAIKRELVKLGVKSVAWARNAESGIAMIQSAIESDKPFGLLVSDMHFDYFGSEDMDAGEKTMNKLREMGIQIPVIFCSSQNWKIPGAVGTVFYNANRDWEGDLKMLLDRV